MPHQFENAGALWRAVPATLILIILSVCGFLVIYLNAPVSLLSKLTFTDFTVVNGQLEFLPTSGEYWRLITPVFLHFGWLHITFNSLWTWELGALIEQRLGSTVLVLLVLFCGVGSNTAQYLWSGPTLFGGMSGVVYALLGFCWVYNALRPQAGLAVPRGIVAFMLIWLVLCMVVSTEALGFGIANAAHAGGLVLGCLLAIPLALWQRRGSEEVDYQQLLQQLSPELVATFKRSLETGRWPDGRVMTEEQRAHCLQAVIAYEAMHLPEEERVGYIDRSRKQDGGEEQKLRWEDEKRED